MCCQIQLQIQGATAAVHVASEKTFHSVRYSTPAQQCVLSADTVSIIGALKDWQQDKQT